MKYVLANIWNKLAQGAQCRSSQPLPPGWDGMPRCASGSRTAEHKSRSMSGDAQSQLPIPQNTPSVSAYQLDVTVSMEIIQSLHANDDMKAIGPDAQAASPAFNMGLVLRTAQCIAHTSKASQVA